VGHNFFKKGLLNACTKSHVQAKSEYPPAKVGDGGQVEIRNSKEIRISKDKMPQTTVMFSAPTCLRQKIDMGMDLYYLEKL